MDQAIEVLELDPGVQAVLIQGGVTTVAQLRDSSLTQLDALGLSDEESQWALDQLDLFLDRRFHSQVLFPMLPEPAHFVECSYLELPSDLLVALETDGFQYLYELALSRRPRLVAKLGAEAVTRLEAALAIFLESYRQGEIVLHHEEKQHD